MNNILTEKKVPMSQEKKDRIAFFLIKFAAVGVPLIALIGLLIFGPCEQ